MNATSLPVGSLFPVEDRSRDQRLEQMLALHEAGASLAKISAMFHISMAAAACLLAERAAESDPRA